MLLSSMRVSPSWTATTLSGTRENRGADIVYTLPPSFLESLLSRRRIWSSRTSGGTGRARSGKAFWRIPYFRGETGRMAIPAEKFHHHPALLTTAKGIQPRARHMVEFIARRASFFFLDLTRNINNCMNRSAGGPTDWRFLRWLSDDLAARGPAHNKAQLHSDLS